MAARFPLLMPTRARSPEPSVLPELAQSPHGLTLAVGFGAVSKLAAVSTGSTCASLVRSLMLPYCNVPKSVESLGWSKRTKGGTHAALGSLLPPAGPHRLSDESVCLP